MSRSSSEDHQGSIENYCEAQARVRQRSARDGSQGERPQSLNPCLELALKLVATNQPTHPPTRKSQYTSLMARWCSGGLGGGKGRCVGSLWLTLGSLFGQYSKIVVLNTSIPHFLRKLWKSASLMLHIYLKYASYWLHI